MLKSGIGMNSGITQFFGGIGIKKTKRYWNRNGIHGFLAGIRIGLLIIA